MAFNAQISQAHGYDDYPYFNYTATDIPSNTAVSIDSTNVIGGTNAVTQMNEGIGIIPPAASGNVVVGVTMEVIKAGSYGRVRCGGKVAMTADGAITAGTIVDASAAALKVGFAKAHVAGKAQLGIAESTAADGEQVLVLIALGFNA